MSNAKVRVSFLVVAALVLSLFVGISSMASGDAQAPSPATADQAPVALGTAANFAVLGGAGVTCTASTVTGVVGSLLTVTQTPTCTIAGTILAADAVTAQAFADFLVAYAALAAELRHRDGRTPVGQDAEREAVTAS